jgi:hypothetical protein
MDAPESAGRKSSSPSTTAMKKAMMMAPAVIFVALSCAEDHTLDRPSLSTSSESSSSAKSQTSSTALKKYMFLKESIATVVTSHTSSVHVGSPVHGKNRSTGTQHPNVPGPD